MNLRLLDKFGTEKVFRSNLKEEFQKNSIEESESEEDLVGFIEIDKQMFPVQKATDLTNHPKKKIVIKSDPMGKTFLEFNSKLVIIDKWPQKTNPVKQEIKQEIIDIEEEPVRVAETTKPKLITVRKGLLKSPIKVAKPLKLEPSSSGKLLKKELNIVKKTLNVVPVEGSKHSYKVLPNFDPKKNLVFISKDQFIKEVPNKNIVSKKEGNENVVVLKKAQEQSSNVLEIYTKLKNSFVSEQVDEQEKIDDVVDLTETEVLKKKYNTQDLLLENSSLLKQIKSLFNLLNNLKNDLEVKGKDFEQLQEDLKSATADLIKTRSDLVMKEENVKHLKEIIKNLNKKIHVDSLKVSVGIQTVPSINTQSTQTEDSLNNSPRNFVLNIPESYVYESNLVDYINNEKESVSPFIDELTSNSTEALLKTDQRIIGDNVNMGNGPKINLPKTITNDPNELWARLRPDEREMLKMKICYKYCDQSTNTGDYPIHIAVKANDLIAVQRQCMVLKLKNVQVDLENTEGLTPLHLAILHHSDSEIVKELIKNKADFARTDKDGNNVFHLAALHSYLLKMDNLEENNYCINNYNYDGITPLILCGIENKYKEAEVLIRYNANVNMQDKKSGRTALFHAVESDSLETVKVLLNNGADKLINNFMGINAQEVATELVNVNKEIKSLLNSTENCENTGRLVTGKKRLKVHNEKFQTVSKRVKM